MIGQVIVSRGRIGELPIPTFYGDEVCHVNGLRYAWDVVVATLKARLVRMGIFYDPKFYFPQTDVARSVSRFSFFSSSRVVAAAVTPGSLVLDLGCSDGELADYLRREKGCTVLDAAGVDLDRELPHVPWDSLDCVLALDVLEERDRPGEFLDRLKERLANNGRVRIIAGSANVAFFITRFMLLLGQFNYSRRGILALKHKRLFTRASLGRLFRYAGYEVLRRQDVGAPYPLALGEGWLARALMAVNGLLVKVLPGLFAWQTVLEARPLPSVASVLRSAQR